MKKRTRRRFVQKAAPKLDKPTLVISRFPKVNNSISWCANCKQAVKVDAETCSSCGVEFTQVTTDCPQPWMHSNVQSMRQDLKYVVFEG